MLRRWNETEPIRLYMYGLVVPMLGLLGAYGVLTDPQVTFWCALTGAVLTPAAEAARAKVTPAGNLHQADPRVRIVRRGVR